MEDRVIQPEGCENILKPLLTSEELIEHMKGKGITFNIMSEPEAKDFLEKNNYYMKLAAYRENYDKRHGGGKDGQYIALDFAYLRELSTIDMHLRYEILHMCLDIEHFLKVALLNSVENNPKEDGYNIVQKFLKSERGYAAGKQLRKNKSAYCSPLIDKYNPNFPVWAFVEMISFSSLIYLCSFYNNVYDTSIGNHVLLNSVRDIRNACAHSNCLINKLIPGSQVPHHSVVRQVEGVVGSSRESSEKKLRIKCIYDFTCVLFAYDDIVTSLATKQKCYKSLKKLFEGRMVEHADWFQSNSRITSAYEFAKKIVDRMAKV